MRHRGNILEETMWKGGSSMKCEYCAQHNPDNSLTCIHCGAPLPVEYTADMKIRYKYISPHCSSCGRHLEETEVFCKDCHTISPVVNQTLHAHPKHSEYDYVRKIHQHHGEIYTDCPYCENTYEEKLYAFTLEIDSPIFICDKCHQAYLRPKKFEWSLLSPLLRVYALFLFNYRWLAFGVAISLMAMINDAWWAWGIPLGALIVTILHLIFERKKVIHSKKRLEANPDYPKTLADMGYGERLHKKYHHLLKHPPLTLKEVLKEAFTFD